jgi:heat shock protein HslJ
MDENERLLLSFQKAENLSSPLAGTSWIWREFQSSADEVITPSNPDQYTLTFKEEDMVEVQADCNFVEGTYHAEDSYISIILDSSDTVNCSPESLSERFLQLVGDSNTYLFTESGELAISILYDSGIIIFTPAK